MWLKALNGDPVNLAHVFTIEVRPELGSESAPVGYTVRAVGSSKEKVLCYFPAGEDADRALKAAEVTRDGVVERLDSDVLVITVSSAIPFRFMKLARPLP